MTREDWLLQLTDALRPMFKQINAELPEKIRVSVGWPSTKATSMKHRAIGQCWSRSRSADKVNQIFISPCLSDATRVAGVHVHELVHAWDDCAHGHKGPFREKAKALGLVGKMTATTESDELKAKLGLILAALPAYPQGAIDFTNVPKQSTRLLKIVCVECGAILRGTRKVIDEVGLPTCACGGDFEEAE